MFRGTGYGPSGDHGVGSSGNQPEAPHMGVKLPIYTYYISKKYRIRAVDITAVSEANRVIVEQEEDMHKSLPTQHMHKAFAARCDET